MATADSAGVGARVDRTYCRTIGYGPTLFSGLSRPLDLELTGREEPGSGAVALTYRLR
ncbi:MULTISPECIES: hypothetical protein [unclassified Gordonia (in: high G+C Gram-positive bacteria)]